MTTRYRWETADHDRCATDPSARCIICRLDDEAGRAGDMLGTALCDIARGAEPTTLLTSQRQALDESGEAWTQDEAAQAVVDSARDLTDEEIDGYARESVTAALDAAGSDPHSACHDATPCLLPVAPLEGDWECAADATGRHLRPHETMAMVTAYARRIDPIRARCLGACDCAEAEGDDDHLCWAAAHRCGSATVRGEHVASVTTYEQGDCAWTDLRLYRGDDGELTAHVVGRFNLVDRHSHRHALYMGADAGELRKQARQVRRLLDEALEAAS